MPGAVPGGEVLSSPAGGSEKRTALCTPGWLRRPDAKKTGRRVRPGRGVRQWDVASWSWRF